MKKLFLIFGLIPLLTSCSHLNTRIAPATRLNSYRNVFVEHELSDGRSVDAFIVRKLQSMGYDAESGPMTMKPVEAELLVTYQAFWTFDFTNYMIEVDMQVRDARTGRELAIGSYFHPSIIGGFTSDMVDPLIERLFKNKSAAKQP